MNQTKVHYKSKILRRLLSAVIAMLLLSAAFPVFHETAMAESGGMIRVKLTRLGSAVSSVTMTTVGSYRVNGKTISSGSTVKVIKDGSALVLTAGGQQLASGSSITMSRSAGGTGTGVKFTSPALSNLFCGDLTFSISGGSIQTVLSIYIETYLYGVVPYEMSNSFPLEALKAQTIAARTYAMRAKRSSGTYDVTDNTSSQVFKGYNAAYGNAIEAVNGTKGIVLMAGSSYAQCYYTASNGGQCESPANAWGSSGVSYLTVKDDPYDRENPNSIVKSYAIPKDPDSKALHSGLRTALIESSAAQLKAKGLSADPDDVSIDEIVSVEPHTPKFDTPSRTYTKLRFTMKLEGKSESTGNKVSTQVEADLDTYSQLQSMLSLSINSTDNEIVAVEETDDSFKLSFSRYGHGIGLSQRGAQWMAKQYGMGYEEILSFYYPGTKQTKLSLEDVISGSAGAEPTPSRAPVESEDGYNTLQEGDSGSAVKALQTRLKELGYFTGTPLGNFRTQTVAAVKAFQTAKGLEPDGIATPELQKMIFAEQQATPAPAPVQTPGVGEDGPSVQTTATVSLSSSSSRLNVRKSASTSAAIVGTLKHGDEVNVLTESGDWRRISKGTLTGYVKASYLRFSDAGETDDPETGTEYTTLQYGDSGEAVRALQVQLQKMGFFTGTPLGNYKTLTTSAVEAYQTAMGLKADGIATPELQEMIFEGRMPAATTAPSATPEPTAAPTPEFESYMAQVSLSSSSSRLNIRRSASTSSGIVGTLRHGAQVKVNGVSGNWSKISADGIAGYVMTSYLVRIGGQPTAVPTAVPTAAPETDSVSKLAVIRLRSGSSKLNVRKSATTASAIVGTLRHGTQVEVLATDGNWSRIRKDSMTGYVMTSYLTMQNSQTPTAAPTATPAPETSGYTTLSYGDSGSAVKALQTRLKELGYFNGQLGGNYLKITRAAVEDYQRANGWPVDGIATPALQKEIFEAKNDLETNATVRVGEDSYLNLRKSASSGANVLARMTNGTRVYVIGSEGDWYQIRMTNGLNGYAKKDYIRMD